MDKEEIRNIVLKYIDAYNVCDIEKISSLLDKDITFKNIANNTTIATAEGISSFTDMISKSTSIFSERNMELITISVENNEVFFETFFTGILNKDLNENILSGDELRIDGHSEFKFNDKNLIYSITDYSRTKI